MILHEQIEKQLEKRLRTESKKPEPNYQPYFPEGKIECAQAKTLLYLTCVCTHHGLRVRHCRRRGRRDDWLWRRRQVYLRRRVWQRHAQLRGQRGGGVERGGVGRRGAGEALVQPRPVGRGRGAGSTGEGPLGGGGPGGGGRCGGSAEEARDARVRPLPGYDRGLHHVPEPSDGRVHVLWVDDLLVLVEGDPDAPLALLPLRPALVLVVRDAQHGDPPVVRSVELCEVVQLGLRFGEAQEGAGGVGRLAGGGLQFVHKAAGASLGEIKTSRYNRNL